MVILTCKNCGKKIKKYPSQIKVGEGKYCSKKCYTQAMKGIDLFSNAVRGRKKKIRVEINCFVCRKLFETVPSKIGVRKFCSKKCYFVYHEKVIKNITQIRNSNSYKTWRLSVYNRDGFKCQSCGQVGKNLNAHHIVPVSVNPMRIFDLDNGITLCNICHKAVHAAYKPKSKQGELLGNLYKIISSQAELGIVRKVQRLQAEARTAGNACTSALNESCDIV